MPPLVAIAFSAIAAFAADITGGWSGLICGPNGDFQAAYTLKQDGTKLTGSVTGPQGELLEIAEGKVDGSKVTFNVVFNGVAMKHEGSIEDDEIKLSVKGDRGDFPGAETTLKRT